MKSLIAFLFLAVCVFAVPANFCGLLRPDGSYIPGSILVWAEYANIAKRWSAPGGIPILTELHDAVVNNDRAMAANQPTDALANFYTVVACLNLARPYITNPQCQQWFAGTYTSFGAIVRGFALGAVTKEQANDYLIKQHPEFKRACGSPTAYNSNYYSNVCSNVQGC